MSGPEDNVVTEHHSERELQILDKFYSRLKKERFVNNQASTYYSSLNQKFVIPGIIITGISSVASFLATSDMLEDHEKQAFSVGVGIMTAVATIIQSLSSSFGFAVKKDAFQTSADIYDSLLTKVEFEIYNPNEKFDDFCNDLETEILKIKSDCKYLPPLHIYDIWRQRKNKKNQMKNQDSDNLLAHSNFTSFNNNVDTNLNENNSQNINQISNNQDTNLLIQAGNLNTVDDINLNQINNDSTILNIDGQNNTQESES